MTKRVEQGGTAAKIALLGSLYFSQGLPFGFFNEAMPVILRQEGFSLGQIGLSSLLAIPWALKFLWAPVVDAHWSPRLGRRRSWILPLQTLTVMVLAGVALSGRLESVAVLMGAFLVLNFLAATQDIATDGLAVDLLSPSERGLANGIQVAGYRVGMILGGGVLLILFGKLGASGTFLAMAALTALATAPVLLAKEPAPAPLTREQAESPVPHFLKRRGAFGLLLLIATYKGGDAFATGMLRPFLSDSGFELEDLGWLLGTVGFVSGVLGALVGGALVNRLGRKLALGTFGLAQAVTVAGYALVAVQMPERIWLYALCSAEHFAGGMATAAMFTCMMDWSSKQSGATDYTVQASAVVIASGVASMLSGFSAQHLGYAAHFALAAVLGLLAMIMVQVAFPKQESV